MNITGRTAQEMHQEWLQDPAYAAEYQSLEAEFSLVASLIEARVRAGLSQEELAAQMQTSQSAVARLEGGYQNTSLKTLKRYAKATGSRLKIILEPLPDVSI